MIPRTIKTEKIKARKEKTEEKVATVFNLSFFFFKLQFPKNEPIAFDILL